MLSISSGGHPCRVDTVTDLQISDGIASISASVSLLKLSLLSFQPLDALLKYRIVFGFDHIILKNVSIFSDFDALQIISNTDVEK